MLRSETNMCTEHEQIFSFTEHCFTTKPLPCSACGTAWIRCCGASVCVVLQIAVDQEAAELIRKRYLEVKLHIRSGAGGGLAWHNYNLTQVFIQTVGIIREYHITTSSACFFTAYSVLVQHPWVNISHPNKAVYGGLFCLTRGCFLAAMCVRIVLNDFLVFSMARQSVCPWLCQLFSCLEHIKRMGSLVCVPVRVWVCHVRS